jgi:hypothetical protein
MVCHQRVPHSPASVHADVRSTTCATGGQLVLGEPTTLGAYAHEPAGGLTAALAGLIAVLAGSTV